MKKKVISGLLLTVLAALALQPTAGEGYSGDITAVVNTVLETENLYNGSFTVKSKLLSQSMDETEDSNSEALIGISGYIVDEETGELRYQREKALPEPPVVSDGKMKGSAVQKNLRSSGTSYTVGQTKTITEESDYGQVQHTMECLYIGTYCTVWGDASANPALMLPTEVAEEIGKQFDEYQPQMIAAFGDWYDRDGDGKLAIFCYDLDASYDEPDGPSTYTCGYFYAADMCDEEGDISDWWGYPALYSTHIQADCIHLDTYPGMSWDKDNLFSDVPMVYSTLVHEFQHLINFSYVAEAEYYGTMETFLNEAFSMAAEHMICGHESVDSRIDYFNDKVNYVTGTALCCWENGGTLSNYSNSYLFGQYIRTRYAQLTRTDGNAIFREILEARQEDCGGDTLELIADILGSTPEDLVMDFWAAVYKKDEVGHYGFNGEDWADRITPKIISAGNKSKIYNGGAKFYQGALTANTKNNVELLTLRTDDMVLKGSVPALSSGITERLGAATATLTLTPTADGQIYYKVSESVLTDKSELTRSVDVTAGETVIIPLFLTVDYETPSRVYYYLRDDSGVACELAFRDINACNINDLDGDGEIGTGDITKLARYVSRIETPDAVMQEMADANGDGILTAADIVLYSEFACGQQGGAY